VPEAELSRAAPAEFVEELGLRHKIYDNLAIGPDLFHALTFG